MNENNYRSFQAVMQVISTIGAVIVFFVALHRYHTEQAGLIQTRIEAEQWARDQEFRRNLWLRQFEVLSKIADTASRIAVAVDSSESKTFDATVREFEQLYWGNVTFVDNFGLVKAMDDLRHEIRYFRDGLKPIDGLSAYDMVRQRAHRVSTACRHAIRESGREYIQSFKDGKP